MGLESDALPTAPLRHVASIDFEKAFDSKKWKTALAYSVKNGIVGKMYRCIKSMHNNVNVPVGHKLTAYIDCMFGVKRGDVCSAVLFSLFINELTFRSY